MSFSLKGHICEAALLFPGTPFDDSKAVFFVGFYFPANSGLPKSFDFRGFEIWRSPARENQKTATSQTR